MDDIRHTNTIRYVMRNGRLYDGETLDALWPDQRTVEIPAWWNLAPVTEAGIR